MEFGKNSMGTRSQFSRSPAGHRIESLWRSRRSGGNMVEAFIFQGGFINRYPQIWWECFQACIFWQQKSWPPVKLPLKFMLKSPGRSFTRTAWRMLGEEVTWNRYTRYISWHKVGFTLWPLNPSDCLIGLWENGLDSKFPPQKREKTHWWFTMV